MDFELSDEQRLLKDSVQRFIEKEYQFEARRKLVAEGGGFSAAHWSRFAEMGWLMAGLPEEHGGLGGSAIETAIILEAFGRGLVVEPLLPVGVLAAQVLLASGNVAALPGLCAGETMPVLAHDEADAGGDVGWVETRAAGGVLNGRKTRVLGAPFATEFLVSARSDAGVGLYRVATDAPGLQRIDVRLVDNSRASELVLDNVQAMLISADALPAIAHGYAHATVALCAEAVGAMDAALWLTRDYLRTRHQFGQPIGNFQALQHRMADMVIELELARSQLFRALAFVDAKPVVRDRAVSSAKVQIGKSARFVGGQAIQLHGGIGVTEEYVIGHYFRRLTMIDNQFGNVGFHLDRMAAGSAGE